MSSDETHDPIAPEAACFCMTRLNDCLAHLAEASKSPSLATRTFYAELRRSIWRSYAMAAEVAEVPLADLCLDELLRHSGWSHPFQVLEWPHAKLHALLAACAEREPGDEASAERLGEIRQRIELLIKLEDKASLRRAQGLVQRQLGGTAVA